MVATVNVYVASSTLRANKMGNRECGRANQILSSFHASKTGFDYCEEGRKSPISFAFIIRIVL